MLKCFLRERGGLDKTKKGGVCSFMLLNMIVSYLQTHQKEASAVAGSKVQTWGEQVVVPDVSLHKHLIRFMRHYGCRLNSRDTGISIRAGGFLYGKSEDDVMNGRSGFTRLCVESPLNRLEDCGQGAYNYALVKKHFKLAHDLLFSYGPHSVSLLALIISDKLFQHYAENTE